MGALIDSVHRDRVPLQDLEPSDRANPGQNASIPDDLEPKFYIFRLSPRRLWRLFSSDKKFAMLETTHSGYCEVLKQVAAENIESVAAAEVLKLSFIRQLKMDRLGAFATVMIPTVILFIIVGLAAPKANTEKSLQTARESSPTVTVLGPRDVYNCAATQRTAKL